MRLIELTDDERTARKYKQRTIHNWKRQYGFSIPIELFDEFKQNKKFYTRIFCMNKDLVKLVANTPVPEEFEPKERKD
jgi:hypothetical protein